MQTDKSESKIKQIKQRDEDVSHFLRKDLAKVKNVYEYDIKNMGDGELIYLQYWQGMGTSDVFDEVGILEDGKINYYRKYRHIYNVRTGEIMESSFLSLKSFKGLEDYDNNKTYHTVFGTKSENKLKNFEVVSLQFGNYVIVNKKFINDYKSFIEKLTKKYDLGEDFFWIHITEVSKIYHSDDKDEFLSF